MATTEEIRQAKRLLSIHKKNLGRLEEQKAKLAGEVSLAIDNQIDEERANIAALEPIANPPPVASLPSPGIQDFVKQTAPGEIDNAMLFMQGVQINARMTKQEEHGLNQEAQIKLIIEEQARSAVWRMQIKETVDILVTQVHASEQARRGGAKWYRRALVLALSLSILALLVALAGFLR